FIVPGDAHRIEIGADNTGGRGGFFDLGDQGDPAVARVTELAGKVTPLAMRFDGPAEVFGECGAFRQRGDLHLFLFNYFFENVHSESSSSATPAMRLLGQPALSQ